VNLASPFIHRPVATTLLAVGLLLLGIVGYALLPVASLPNVDFPTLQISAALPGANPETMASNVATPLERQLSLIPGIAQMTSVNSLGSTSITLQFELSQNLTDDFEQVQAAINAASAQLPTNLPAQPSIRKVNPSDAPIMILSLRSDTLPLDQVDNYADVILSQQVSRIDGVGLVTIGGQQKPAVRIQIDPRKIAARGLQIDTVRQQIVNSTVNSPKGTIVGQQRNLTVYANDQILDAEPWNDVIVGYQSGAPVRIRDIGKAFASVENDQIGAWVFPGKGNTDPTMKGGPGILLVIFKAPGANVIDTVNQIRAALPGVLSAGYVREWLDLLRLGLESAGAAGAAADLDYFAGQWSLGRNPFAFEDGRIDPLGLTGRPRRKPVVIAVQGRCWTVGLELLLAADVRVAAANTDFAQLEVLRGIYPGGGATIRLVQEIGWGNAMRWLLTGDSFDAGEALRLGLVQSVVDLDQLIPVATGIAARIAEAAPLGVQAIRESARLSVEAGFEAAAGRLFPELVRLFTTTADGAEGYASFRERRRATFTGQ